MSLICAFAVIFFIAERVGFEPTVPRRYTRFPVVPIQPLSHLSRTSVHYHRDTEKDKKFKNINLNINFLLYKPQRVIRVIRVPFDDPKTTYLHFPVVNSFFSFLQKKATYSVRIQFRECRVPPLFCDCFEDHPGG